MRRINELRTGEEAKVVYVGEGFGMRVVEGGHAQRDAAVTEDGDNDMLWVREETRELYGAKYRPGGVSGTQKTKDRRAEKDRRGDMGTG